jgi:RNA polymerase sigma-B factor
MTQVGGRRSPFAVPTILGELKRHFRDKGWAIHLPRGLQELVLKVKAADDTLTTKTGHSPTVLEIADYLEVDTEQVLEALEAASAQRATWLDAPIDTDEPATIHDTIGCDDQGYALIETSASLAEGIKTLRTADRRVLALRVQQELKQREIAERMGVSQMQISRVLRRISKQLRTAV